MKYIIKLLCAMLVFSLCACSNASNNTDNSSGGDVGQGKDGLNQVIYEDDNFSITADSFEENDSSYILECTVENKMDDELVHIQSNYVAANKCQLSKYRMFGQDVFSKESESCSLELKKDYLNEMGIEKPVEIAIGCQILNGNYESIMPDLEVVVYPYGEDKANSGSEGKLEEKKVLYEDDYIKMSLLDLPSDETSFNAKVMIQNKNDYTIVLTTWELKEINGISLDSLLSSEKGFNLSIHEVGLNKYEIGNFEIDQETLNKIGVDQVDSCTFSMTISKVLNSYKYDYEKVETLDLSMQFN